MIIRGITFALLKMLLIIATIIIVLLFQGSLAAELVGYCYIRFNLTAGDASR